MVEEEDQRNATAAARSATLLVNAPKALAQAVAAVEGTTASAVASKTTKHASPVAA
ncbi:hypothetical protein HGRIS_012669 [Hohenbuehelia grisea]|uniref:Uncharacterized protein n=1 Tax=Hohenbuehelia grisea TaxID=104357 RepID=A0ABR3IT04_9AGAR